MGNCSVLTCLPVPSRHTTSAAASVLTKTSKATEPGRLEVMVLPSGTGPTTRCSVGPCTTMPTASASRINAPTSAGQRIMANNRV